MVRFSHKLLKYFEFSELAPTTSLCEFNGAHVNTQEIKKKGVDYPLVYYGFRQVLNNGEIISFTTMSSMISHKQYGGCLLQIIFLVQLVHEYDFP